MIEVFNPQILSYKEAFKYSIEKTLARNHIMMPTLGIHNAIGGINDDDFVVITARGGTGKTWLLLQMAFDLAVSGKKIAFFSGEMSVEEIVLQRVAKMNEETKILGEDCLPSKKLETLDSIKEIPIWFPVIENRWKFREQCAPLMNSMREKYGIDIFFFDHMRYFLNAEPSQNGDRQVVEQTVQDFRLYAKKYKTPIFLAVQPRQMSSDEETTVDSLKGTSAISQEATTIIVMDRKRMKSAQKRDDEDNAAVFHPYINLKIEKARHGKGNSNVKIYLDWRNGRFIEWDKGGSELHSKDEIFKHNDGNPYN